MPAEMIGLHAMRDATMAVGIGLVFGYTHAGALAALARVAERHGVQAMHPAPDRTLLLTGVSALNAHGLTAAAERLGFVVHADDPRRRIAACPGTPACASAFIPARELAAALASQQVPVRATRGVAVHISGCPKGCAHPGPAALTLVGMAQGCGVIHDDSAQATPRRYVDPVRLGEELPRLATDFPGRHT
jgi:precorrin-3B synthase